MSSANLSPADPAKPKCPSCAKSGNPCKCPSTNKPAKPSESGFSLGSVIDIGDAVAEAAADVLSSVIESIFD